LFSVHCFLHSCLPYRGTPVFQWTQMSFRVPDSELRLGCATMANRRTLVRCAGTLTPERTWALTPTHQRRRGVDARSGEGRRLFRAEASQARNGAARRPVSMCVQHSVVAMKKWNDPALIVTMQTRRSGAPRFTLVGSFAPAI